MADYATTHDQVKEITDKLEAGIKDLFTSDKFTEYLKTMSRFYNYSTRNTLLIHIQKPTATYVTGYEAWKQKFERNVKKGEKGIKILAPIATTTTKETEKLDPDTGIPLIGADGKPVYEKVEIKVPRFKTVTVFDVAQTHGKPLPNLAEDLTGDVQRYELFMNALKEVSPLPISIENLAPNTDGYCKFGEKIAIRGGMSEIQTVSAVVHEIAHAMLHDIKAPTVDADETTQAKSRRTEEVEAESISYAVCQYYGIETSANSFGYVATWSKEHELPELKASLDTIRKTSATLIDKIDEKFKELAKERGIDLTAPIATTETPAEENIPQPVEMETSRYSAMQQKGFEIAKGYEELPLQDRLNIIAKTFNCETASVGTTPCSGKWRGTSDIYIELDNGATLGIGNRRTPQAKTAKVINECVNNTLAQYNPEIVAELKTKAAEALIKRQYEDNAVAAEKGLKPYTFLNVGLNDGSDESSGGHLGWYYTALEVDGKVIEFVESGLNSDIARGVLSEHISTPNYFVAGGLQDNEVDFVFNNVGHSSWKGLYQMKYIEDTHINTGIEEDMVEQESPVSEILGVAEQSAMPPDYHMPDPFMSLQDSKQYGYTSYEDMLPMSQSVALELFDLDRTIFLLYPDDTEAMVFDREEILAFDGLFGIESKDWYASKEYHNRLEATAKDSETSKEGEMLGADTSMFGIYQLKRGEEYRDYCFEGLEHLEKRGLSVDRVNYEIVYTAPLASDDTKNKIYERFNIDHPDDFTGHSLSVSDILVFQEQGIVTSFFVDSFGFKELSSFLGVESVPQPIIAEEKTPTVAELEAEVKAGNSISVLDLAKAVKNEKSPLPKEKPSILAKLHDSKKQLAQGNELAKTSPKRDDNREV